MAVIGLATYHTAQIRHQKAEAESAAAIASLQAMLDALIDDARRELDLLKEPVRNSAGDVQAISALLAGQINKGNGVVRYAFIDARNRMRVSSVSGIRKHPYDLSDRDYVKQARQRPFTIITSPTLLHRITHTPVTTLAMGIAGFDGRHLGVLNAAINHPLLIDRIRIKMKICGCDYVVFSPHGEPVMQSFDSASGQQRLTPLALADSPQIYFHARGHVMPSRLHDISNDFMILGGGLMAVFSLCCLLVWALITVRVLAPVRRWARAHLPHPDRSPLAVMKLAEDHLSAICHQASGYTLLAQELKSTSDALCAAQSLIALSRQREALLTEATSRHLHEAFDVIHHYAQHIEELIATRLIDPDARYDYDDVAEMGMHLGHMGTCLRYLSPHLADGHVLPAIIWAHAAEVALKPLAAMAERRNIRIDYSAHPSPASDEAVALWESLCFCLIYEAIRLTQDEGEVHIHCPGDGIRIRLSSLRSRLLPPQRQDFGTWLPRLGAISADGYAGLPAGWQIAASLLDRAGWILTLHTPKAGSVLEMEVKKSGE